MFQKRRAVKFTAVVAVCVGAALAVIALLPPRPGVTKANFDQIQDGMKVADAQRILGGTGLPFHGFVNQGPTLVWQSEDGSLAFVEHVDQTIINKMWHASNESLLDKLRRWLRLPK